MKELYEVASAQFRLPNGTTGGWFDVVPPSLFARYVEEVKMLQKAIGAHPDGLIGIETRTMAEKIYQQRQKKTGP
jgi:lysozyme family protein